MQRLLHGSPSHQFLIEINEKAKNIPIEEVLLSPKVKKTSIGIYEIKILIISQSFEMTSIGKVLNHKFTK